jgi:hypothetical protein
VRDFWVRAIFGLQMYAIASTNGSIFFLQKFDLITTRSSSNFDHVFADMVVFTQWVSMDKASFTDLSGKLIPQFVDLYQNVLGVLPAYDASAPRVQDFFSAYQSRPYSPALNFSTALGKLPNIVALLTYDAVFSFAHAWNRSIEVFFDCFLFLVRLTHMFLT